MVIINHDPAAHLFYEVDWTGWVANRGYTANDIVSVTWSNTSGSANITHTSLIGSKARVWVKDITLGKKITITSKITMPAPAANTANVIDEYSFQLLGKNA